MDGIVPWTWWPCSDVGHSQQGMKESVSYLGRGNAFTTQKPLKLIDRIIRISSPKHGYVLDFFAGSGTTADATIRLNQEEEASRKYFLVEMGSHFDVVLKARIQKSIYSKDWKDGKPASREGISHCFKYLRLESYEDTLNNLVIASDPRRDEILASDMNGELRKSYLLNYFLDVETQSSASLLNIQQFRDPTAYSLMVKKPGSESQQLVNVDLVETFNWLLGLDVALLDKSRTFGTQFHREQDPELPDDQHTRLLASQFKEDPLGTLWFRRIEGTVRKTPDNETDVYKVMVLWRKLSDNPEQDAAALQAYLEKHRINQGDSEFDQIYINGSHGLNLGGSASTRLFNIEETFMARMWADADENLAGDQH